METQKFDFFLLKFEFWLLTNSWNHLIFVNISPTLVIDTSMERSSRVLHHGNPKMWKFFKKFEIDEIEFCPYPEFPNAEKRNHLSFVNISPTLAIDTSMERSSRVVVTPWKLKKKKKIEEKNQKSLKFEFWLLTKSWNHHSFVNISPTLVIDTSTERSSRVLQHENQKIWFFFQKSSKLNSTCILTCAEELKSTFK